MVYWGLLSSRLSTPSGFRRGLTHTHNTLTVSEKGLKKKKRSEDGPIYFNMFPLNVSLFFIKKLPFPTKRSVYIHTQAHLAIP